MDYRALAGLCGAAIEAGAERVSLGRFRWDASQGCLAPQTVEHYVRPHDWAYPANPGVAAYVWKELKRVGLLKPDPRVRGFQYDPGSKIPLWLEISVPCRRCARCLRRRAMKWRKAALSELERASRTWFCTFTLTQHVQFMLMCRASKAEANRSNRFEEFSGSDRFRSMCSAFGPDLTRFLKRVRKNSGAKIRYLFVAEAHKSGLPHWHALMHEVDPTRPLRKRSIEDAWGYGFTNCRLVSDEAPAWYVCKYLTKDVATRVRSSLHYGRSPETTFVDSHLKNGGVSK